MLKPFAKDLFFPAADNFSTIFPAIVDSFRKSDLSKKVVVLLIDAFGRYQIERQRERSDALVELLNNSTCSVTTSQFPSTTTAHVTTAFFNLPVGAHGLYEWQIYEPLCDELFLTLQYQNLAGGRLPPVELLVPFKTIFDQLSEFGVTSTIVSPSIYLRSPYNSVAARGATYVGYERNNWAQTLSDAIAKMEDRSYLYFYFPSVDEAGHDFGPDSEEVSTQVDKLCTELTKLLSNTDVEWLLTADHGMVSVDPRKTIRLDLECPWLRPLLKRNSSGRVIGPAGSERDLFIHTTETDEVVERLRSHLGERAEVRTAEEMIRLGFFGESVSERLRSRIGDVVVLPVEGESVWMMEDVTRLGQHGGLTKREIETCILRNK